MNYFRSTLRLGRYGEVDFESFLVFARESISSLRDFLGDESFEALRVVDKKIPSAGEIVLLETHGLRLETVAQNLQKFVERLDGEVDLLIQQSSSREIPTAWRFIRQLDDIADVGTLVGRQADEAVHNLLEYHLSLINHLRQFLPDEGIEKLIKRFSARNALRGDRLVPYWAANQESRMMRPNDKGRHRWRPHVRICIERVRSMH